MLNFNETSSIITENVNDFNHDPVNTTVFIFMRVCFQVKRSILLSTIALPLIMKRVILEVPVNTPIINIVRPLLNQFFNFIGDKIKVGYYEVGKLYHILSTLR